MQFQKQGGGGVIVNTSSWLSHGAVVGSSVYSASKGGLDAMTRALALEGGPHGIRVNNVLLHLDLAKLIKPKLNSKLL